MNSKTITKKASAAIAALTLAASMTPMAAFADEVEYSGNGNAQTTFNVSVPKDNLATNKLEDARNNLMVSVPSVVNMSFSADGGTDLIAPSFDITNYNPEREVILERLETSTARMGENNPIVYCDGEAFYNNDTYNGPSPAITYRFQRGATAESVPADYAEPNWGIYTPFNETRKVLPIAITNAAGNQALRNAIGAENTATIGTTEWRIVAAN